MGTDYIGLDIIVQACDNAKITRGGSPLKMTQPKNVGHVDKTVPMGVFANCKLRNVSLC